MITTTEAWLQQTRQACLDACSAAGGEVFRQFGEHGVRALLPDELRRYTPHSLSACLLDFWRFTEEARQDIEVRVFNPDVVKEGWRADGTVVEVCAREMPFLLNTLRIVLNRSDCEILTLMDLNLPLRRDRGQRIQAIPSPLEAQALEYRTLIHIELAAHYEGPALTALDADIRNALGMLHIVVATYPRMQTLCREIGQNLIDNLPRGSDEAVNRMESHAFLQWLARSHFTFLAMLHQKPGGATEKCGLAAWPGMEPDWLTEQPVPEEHPGIFFAKSLSRSPIHHDRQADVIIIPTPDGSVYRIMGLYTSRVQQHDPMTMPVLRQKLSGLDIVSGLRKLSHEGRNFDRLLRTHPRDELLLATEADLLEAFLPMVKQKYGNELRFIWRLDPWKRFVSVFIYLPKPVFNEAFVSRTAEFLQARFNATDVEVTPFVSEHRWIRLHLLLVFAHLSPPAINVDETEAVLKRLARTWDDELLTALIAKYPPVLANQLFRRYQTVFPDNYKDHYRALDAAVDIGWLETQRPDAPLAVEVIPAEGRSARFKLLNWHQQLSLSRVMPILESFGLKVLNENTYGLLLQDSCLWLHDFRTELPESLSKESQVQSLSCVREAMQVLWRGEAEADVFNRMVTLLPCRWREANLFRALSAWLKQSGFPLSAQAQADALTRYPVVGRLLLDLFHARFDPALNGERQRRQQDVAAALDKALSVVKGQSDDRILQQFRTLILAMQRTSFYRQDSIRHNRLSFKLASREIPELPEPRPWREIFVHAPEVSGVHLRFGPVARGGLRWSERPEDFRTEVLGLVKAQQVKNAVIVPVGSKGGFVVRENCPGDSRQERGLNAYRIFIRGLLDLTDNRVEDRVVPPAGVVAMDPDDAYLVVAADKGTASFSDTANALSAEYNFWLGDAFASGGSNGYDHKELGITARGAFVALTALARECGFNPLTDNFSMCGIGSMSGDVFGNGLQLSRTVKLKAAFSHSHILLDPDPEPEIAWEERQRLFTCGQGSWEFYNPECISAGGGVFSRQNRQIPLSPQVRQMLDLSADTATPDEVVRAILAMCVDVLWNGGIGTYIKSAEETHAQAGDRSNDTVRIDAGQLRARIICEGGNLGLTQRARIDYAQQGGRCHTDAIDNSGGVDCSDHEVNLKIFLHREIRAARLTVDEVSSWLHEWEQEVSAAVLANNHAQVRCLGIAAHDAEHRHREYGKLAEFLEEHAGLDRKLEFLPDHRGWEERARNHQPLTRPELAVLMAYTKNWLKSSLACAELGADSLLTAELDGAFPEAAVRRFGDRLREHPLALALAATRLAGQLTERLGMGALARLLRKPGVTGVRIAQAWVTAKQILDLDDLWLQLEAMSAQLPPATVTRQFSMLQKVTRRTCDWLLDAQGDQPCFRRIASFAILGDLLNHIPDHFNRQRREDWIKLRQTLTGQGFPEALAGRLSALDQIVHMLDVCRLARERDVPVQVAAHFYVTLEEQLGMAQVQRALQALPVASHWESQARDAMRSAFQQQMARLTAHTLGQWQPTGEDAQDWLSQWFRLHPKALKEWEFFHKHLNDHELGSYAAFMVVQSRLEILMSELVRF